jgi:Ras family
MFLIRLLIVGDTGVGKTSLLIRFNEDAFFSNQKTTIGVDYKAKEITIGDESVKLQVPQRNATYGDRGREIPTTLTVQSPRFFLETTSLLRISFFFSFAGLRFTDMVSNVHGRPATAC